MNLHYSPQKGDFFVCISENFENAKIHHAYENKEDNNELYAYYIAYATKGKETETIKKKITELPQPFFPSFFYRRNDISGLEEMFETYQRISRKIEDLLLTKDGYSNSIPDTIEHLIKDQEETKQDVEIIIKVLTSELLIYKYKKIKSGEFIEFSELKSDSERSRLYYGSLADEIKIKSEKIALLVSHGQTVGNYREHILRGLLKKYIPIKFGVGTGFIEGISRQIDIIIYDSQNHSPTFIEGDLVVVRREAVRAIIEVKSELTTAKLQEALQFFYDISRPGIYKPNIPVFKGIFSFDTTYTESKGIAKCIRDFYSEPYFEEKLQSTSTRDVMYLLHEVTCVTVLKKHCIFSQYMHANGNETDNIIPVLCSISDRRKIDIQTAMFIALLFDYLDVDYNAKQSTLNAFSKLHRSKTADIKIEIKLTADDWIPRSASSNEHDFKQESIKKRIERIYDWFYGKMSTTAFLIE